MRRTIFNAIISGLVLSLGAFMASCDNDLGVIVKSPKLDTLDPNLGGVIDFSLFSDTDAHLASVVWLIGERK